MRIIENFKICIYRLITGGMFRQLAFLFIFFVLVFISLSYMLDMESSRLFHNMTSFDYPPKDNNLLLQLLYLTGVVFFSGFLVMVLTNSVRNKIDLFKSGDVRLRYIVGENEDNSDYKNMECYSELCKLHNFKRWDSNIFLFLKEQSSFIKINLDTSKI